MPDLQYEVVSPRVVALTLRTRATVPSPVAFEEARVTPTTAAATVCLVGRLREIHPPGHPGGLADGCQRPMSEVTASLPTFGD